MAVEELPVPTRPRAKTVADILQELPAEARLLFEALQALRYQIAQEEKVPAYIVFDNKTLHQMAVSPASLPPEALQTLQGVGPRQDTEVRPPASSPRSPTQSPPKPPKKRRGSHSSHLRRKALRSRSRST